MTKQILSRGLLGALIGSFIAQTILLIISLVWGKGHYLFVTPELATQFGSELTAVLVQHLLSLLMGAVIGASSLIWEIDTWSTTKQTVIHFLILSGIMLPIAYVNYWMRHTISGILSYFLIFIGIYIILWVIMTKYWANQIKSINTQLAHQQK